MKQRFLHTDYLDALIDLKKGYDVDADTLGEMYVDVNNPSNNRFPHKYIEITEADFELINKEAIGVNVY